MHIRAGIKPSSQLSIFEIQEMEEKINKMATECKWVESIWNKNIWYYQDTMGYSISDDYGRTKHNGTMLPKKI